MGSLIVRGVDDDLISRLKGRAVAPGRSAETEHREILRRACHGGIVGEAVWRFARKDPFGPDFEQSSDEIIRAMEGGDV